MARPINLVKKEMGGIIKVILDNNTKELRSKLQPRQWNNKRVV